MTTTINLVDYLGNNHKVNSNDSGKNINNDDDIENNDDVDYNDHDGNNEVAL